MPAKEKILSRLLESAYPVPIHALNIPGVSECSASARLRELRRDGIVCSVPVPGKKFTAWIIAPKEPELPLCQQPK